jgi:hypothetical protein
MNNHVLLLFAGRGYPLQERDIARVTWTGFPAFLGADRSKYYSVNNLIAEAPGQLAAAPHNRTRAVL